MQHLGNDSVLVHGLIDRLAHGQFIGRSQAGIHCHGTGGQRCGNGRLEARIVQAHKGAGGDFAVGTLNQVDFTGLQGNGAAVRVGDDFHQYRTIARFGPPVVRVALEAVELATAGLRQYPGPGAHRHAGLCLGGGKAQRANLRQFHQGRVVGVFKHQHQGVLVRCFDTLQGGDQLHPLMTLAVGEHRVEVGLGCGCVERTAVTEGHTVAQGEGVGLAVC